MGNTDSSSPRDFRIYRILRNPLVASLVGITVFLLVTVALRLRSMTIEEFTAKNFARAVVAQNPKVFERLAEM